ncbi:PREDICTED: probable transcription factor PosF21 [Tarenaya hassleriana]|uniref:probable transcription factor PosF21 n=1 Tax=Tarenaya hassleriana TaxID=28532 RepID=UPI00053C6FDF|nr:PREDICTED: probable transcription factor PosF21 [Tarenaya hassleriana]XP_010531491.1 PREDICTED: probable transcription factor PosF21 [Tarenaya hassleriana]
MGDTEKGNTDMLQRIHSSLGTSSSSIPKQPLSMNQQLDIPHLNPNLIRSPQFPQFPQPFNSSCSGAGDSGRRLGIPPSPPNPIPPISPYSQIPATRQPASQNFNPGPTHSRSLSQPSSFFSFDSLPPLSPSPFRDSPSASDHDVPMEDRDSCGLNPSLPPSPFTRCNSSSSSSRVGDSLPPRKAHRRSNSDIPFGFNSMMVSNSAPLIPPRPVERSVSGGEGTDWSKTAHLVKRESSCEREGAGERKLEGDVVDDLFSAYMNLENIDVLNSSGAEDSKNGNENREDMESSRASGTKTNGGNSSDTEGESSVDETGSSFQKIGTGSMGEKTEGVKRSAGRDIAPTSRHYRSVSMDSCFMGKLNFGDESPKLPPSPGNLTGKVSPTNSFDGNSSNFSLELGNGEFTAAEMKKIMANEKLVEIAVIDPKRVKRILANRQSAARSKERKMRYIAELEHKVQTLQTEATTLSAQLTLLQRDSIGLTNQNNELKFRLQAMEQQAQLRDALNEALMGEVQRLKVVTGELSHSGGRESERSKLQALNPEMFQQLNISQPPSNQNGTITTKPESNE